MLEGQAYAVRCSHAAKSNINQTKVSLLVLALVLLLSVHSLVSVH